MNAINLQKEARDPNTGAYRGMTHTDLWLCECGRVWHGEREANTCCKKWICERCQRSAYNFHTYCSACEEFFRIEKAELIEDWDDWIYVDGYGSHNDGFFSSIDEFMEYYGEESEGDEESSIPEFAFCCKEIPFPSFSVERLLENYMDNFEDGESEYNRLQGWGCFRRP
jgi:hypothetical protein